ncbi:hypothetical protein RhiLY_03410 [Ceratobasidium sp. AG-Ba]|nr:hypothetical protein RhiLY_03410 [Ceratobasidium sp. AG-Ba]
MGVFAYYDTDTEAIVYHVLPSPEDDDISGTTIQSDELPGYFIIHHGRQQPASDNAPKWFPSDNIRRHILRYLVSKTLLGGHYSGPIKDMLTPLDGRVRQALDIGTRTGTWIQGLASEFPHARFRSLDIVPMMPHVPRHNIVFEVYDFTQGLRLEEESQDVVFLNIVLEMH